MSLIHSLCVKGYDIQVHDIFNEWIRSSIHTTWPKAWHQLITLWLRRGSSTEPLNFLENKVLTYSTLPCTRGKTLSCRCRRETERWWTTPRAMMIIDTLGWRCDMKVERTILLPTFHDSRIYNVPTSRWKATQPLPKNNVLQVKWTEVIPILYDWKIMSQ